MLHMGAMILPLAVVLIAGLAVLGLVIAERYPVSTWRERLRDLGQVARDKEPGRVRFVSQDVSLDEMWIRDSSSAYTGTDRFEGLVGVVERTMDTAETKAAALRRSRETKAAARSQRSEHAVAS